MLHLAHHTNNEQRTRARSQDEAVFLGVSWGAYVATRVATRHPSRVSGLVAVGIGQSDPPMQFSQPVLAEMRELVARCEAGDEDAWEVRMLYIYR